MCEQDVLYFIERAFCSVALDTRTVTHVNGCAVSKLDVLLSLKESDSLE